MPTNESPYQAPATFEPVSIPSSTLYAPRSVSAGNGLRWIGEGYRLFRKSLLGWFGITLIWCVLTGLSMMIPLASNLVQPLLIAGIAMACLRLDTTDKLSLEDLFAGFKQQTGSLVLIGAISVGATFIIIIASFVLGLSSVLSMAEMTPDAIAGGEADEAILTLLLLLLIAVTIMTPLIMATWFAPLLVIIHKIPTLEAMRLSFRACLHNWIPFLIYGFAAIPLMILATLPLLLGFLILIPVLMASVYTSYKDIFLRDADQET